MTSLCCDACFSSPATVRSPTRRQCCPISCVNKPRHSFSHFAVAWLHVAFRIGVHFCMQYTIQRGCDCSCCSRRHSTRVKWCSIRLLFQQSLLNVVRSCNRKVLSFSYVYFQLHVLFNSKRQFYKLLKNNSVQKTQFVFPYHYQCS